MSKIFISQSNQDTKFALQLANLLVKLGFDVWIDPTGIRWLSTAGTAYQTVLDQCDMMILVVSPEAIKHPFLEGEWQHYLDTGKRVIPVIWRTADVPLPLQRAQAADFQGGDFQAALTLLLAELGKPEKGAEKAELHLIKGEGVKGVQAEANSAPPANRMERFTQRARNVLALAQEDAIRLQHGTIGTEHLLLAMIREGGGVASGVLRELGMEQARVEPLIVQLTPISRHLAEHPALSAGSKRLIELAVDEARRMGHRYIGTEHFLLGLARMTDGIAIEILKRLGISPADIRKVVRRVFQESPSRHDDALNPPDEPQQPPEENSP